MRADGIEPEGPWVIWRTARRQVEAIERAMTLASTPHEGLSQALDEASELPEPVRQAYEERLALEGPGAVPLRRSVLRARRLEEAPLIEPRRRWIGQRTEAGIELPEPGIMLRLDQIEAARWWGVALDDGAELEAEIQARLGRALLIRLARDLRDATLIEQRLDGAPMDQAGPARLVERLVVDVLNEPAPVARLAPLREDVLEQTDLRVKPEGITRRRGVRVQITLAVGGILARKRRIARRQGIVLCSPTALAHGLLHGAPGLTSEISAACRAALPDSTTVEGVATHLKHVCLAAVENRNQVQNPWGPSAQVPAAVRRAVRAWVLGAAKQVSASAGRSKRR